MRAVRDQPDDLTSPTVPAQPSPPGEAMPRGGRGQIIEDGVQVGDVVGRHVLTAELGRGGMGHVFAAHDADLDRVVAIKFVSVVSEPMVERFLAEARATARCIHPNIVSVHEIGRHLGAPYLVLEHLAGPSLAQLAHGERLPLMRVIAIMTAVARALACAHSHGIVHRDLTPGNIVVLPDDTVKVLDFGIAAYAQEAGAGDEPASSTAHREIAGTLPYMGPEQVAGGALDGRADLWSFGVVFYELLAGVRPFDHLAGAARRSELLNLERPTPSIADHRADLPAEVVRVVMRCLEKPRARRYRSANELVAALQRLADDHEACELPLWLASAPSADEADRVALALVRALVARGDVRGVDPGRTRVGPDGRVELAAGAGPASAADDVRAVAQLASQAIDVGGGIRTAVEARRARRMRRALRSRVSARQLERRLAAAYAPRRARTVATLVLVAAVAVVAVVAGWRWNQRAPVGSARTQATPPAVANQLDRLESAVARLRSAGDVAAADVLFDRFVAQPENGALRADAWLRRAAREQAARDFEPALASAAAAYLAAPDAHTAARALTSVVAVQLARRRWDEVEHALAVLGPTSDPTIAHAADALAIATRRSVPRGPAVAASLRAAARLLAGRQEPAAPRVAEAIDLDGDGRAEVVAVDGGMLRGWRPGGASLWQLPLSTGNVNASCSGRDAGGAWFATTRGVTRLFRVDASAATLELELGPSDVCALGDLDGDGAAEFYVVVRRELRRYRAEAAGWGVTRVSIGSEINALVAADLDGDGRSELALAAGEWRAYDVRVLTGAAMTQVDRIRLGRVSALAALAQGPDRPRVLLARKDANWPSMLFLPPSHPTGAPEGFYALRLERGRLVVAGFVADELHAMGAVLHAADLDGDGRDEGLATELARDTHVLRLDEAGGIDSVTLAGVAVLTAGRFEDTAAVAVLARVATGGRSSTWWLGLGATPLPSIEPAPRPAVAPPPASLDAALAIAWRRATDLARMGATASARAAFEQLAAVVPPELQPSALAEVLVLRQREGEPLGAIHESLAALAAPGSEAQFAALTAAVTAAVDDGELVAAVRVIDAALGSHAVSAVDRVRLHATRTRVAPIEVTLFDGARLDDAWQILDPVGVRRDPVTRALVLDGFGNRSLAAIALARGRGPIELIVDGTITRAEWSAGIRLALQPIGAGTVPVAITISTTGGGGVYQLGARIEAASSWARSLVPHLDVAAPVELRVRLTWFPDTGRATWDVTAGGVHVRQTTVALAPTTATRWRVEISSRAANGDESPTRMALAVARVAVAGLVPEPAAPSTRLAEARLALANGDHDRVRALLGGASDADAMLVAAVRALRAGDRAAAITALASAHGRASAADRPSLALAHLARVDDGAYADEVRAAAGSARVAVIARAWITVARQHPQAELVQRELTQNLRELDLRGPTDDAATLLLLRARARATIGDLVAAQDDLDTLLAPPRLGSLPETVHSDGELERARLALRRGADAEARRAVLAALDASPWPESVADTVLLDPALAALAAGPGLERVQVLGRTLAGR